MLLIIEADGGSRGNPGPAGYGAVVRDAASGEVLAEVAEAIGVATNNVAEYRGLIAGLKAAAELAPRAALEVLMDSKLVVEQLSGRWRIKHPSLMPLAREARQLAAGFTGVRYAWVPRERNTHADRLANEAMDAAAQGKPWSRHATGEAAAAPSGQTGPGAESEQRLLPGVAAVDGGEPGAAPGLGGAPGPGWVTVTSPPTVTWLLRHGETPLSSERRFAGVGDIVLTERGLAQARAAAAELARQDAVAGRIDAIITSPLKRARQTAGEVAAVVDAELIEDEGFREMDFGKWEGLTLAEARARWPEEVTAYFADPAAAPPGGESVAATLRRVRAAKGRLIERFRGRTVLVVTHVTPIKVLARLALLAPAESLFRMHLDVASLSLVDWYDDGLSILRRWNDTRHLEP